jgi:8-oxo-dGTP pyrophosphatase MutT (NUDIX family)
MFLFHLTPAERHAFVGLAKHLIAVDDHEGADEAAALRQLEAELGIPVADIPAAAPSSELLGTFAGSSSRGAVVLELLALAYADGLPHPNEMEMLKAVAVGLGIPELRLLEMEDWVVQQIPRNAEANAFLIEGE